MKGTELMSLFSKVSNLFKNHSQDSSDTSTTPKTAHMQSKPSLADHFSSSRNMNYFSFDKNADFNFQALSNEEKYKHVFQVPIGTDTIELRNPIDSTVTKTLAMDAMPWAKEWNEEQDEQQGQSHPLVYEDPIKDTVWSHYQGEYFIGWQACAMLAQNDIIHLACNIPAEDAVACGWRLAFADSDDADKDKDGSTDTDYLTKLQKATDFYGIGKVCSKLLYNKRVFGTGIAFPLIYRNGKLLDMSKPFNVDGIKKSDTYKGWKIVEPYWLAPQFDADSRNNPLSERYLQPTWYRFPNGQCVHHTWFIKVDNVEPTDILKATYHYGGIPLSQQIYKRVWCAEKTANEAPLLAMSKRLMIIDADVDQIINNNKYVHKLMETVTNCRNNWGVMFKRSGTEIQQIDTSLSEFEECMMSQYQLVASIAQMPATKLLQTTPKGFNSTGEYEWKIYAQLLQTMQENDLRPLIEKHLMILTAVSEGKSRILTVVFNPVDAPTLKDKADIESTKASTRTQYVSSNILTPQEVRNVLRNDPQGEFSGIPIKNPDLDKKDENGGY